MVFQEPMTSLNPVFKIGSQVAETLRVHERMDKQRARARSIELLELVGISEPTRRFDEYPHQLSGGMRQRVMIAMALACSPQVLIADEPTTALDVTIQAQILDLLSSLQRDFGMALLFVTHDLGVVAEIADRVVVMYSGRAVEEGSVEELFLQPRMPYTSGLLQSVPHPESRRSRLSTIDGDVPDPRFLPSGCSFHPRCTFVQDRCATDVPPLEEVSIGHRVRCHRWNELLLDSVETVSGT
jgi:oligopeptide/dipeptide ABC transporter ATP-binding protein